jgi:hypothetical protein
MCQFPGAGSRKSVKLYSGVRRRLCASYLMQLLTSQIITRPVARWIREFEIRAIRKHQPRKGEAC